MQVDVSYDSDDMVVDGTKISFAHSVPGKLFSLGVCFLTNGVSAAIKNGDLQQTEIENFLQRHASGDWGTMSPSDREQNDHFAREGKGTIYSEFKVDSKRCPRIWIITHLGNETTILFPNEY
jgi:hypothetical protein